MTANEGFFFLIGTFRLKLLKVIDVANPRQQEEREERCDFSGGMALHMSQ